MLFKGLKFGKKKDKEKGKAPAVDAAVTPMAELEEQLKDRTNSLAQTENKLKKLSDESSGVEIDVLSEHPHGPIDELSIEPTDSLSGVDTDEPEDIEANHEKEQVDDSLIEQDPVPKKSFNSEGAAKTNLDADSLKALFTSQIEDENPLTSLINSLPDVSIDELMDDLKEIKDIIRDWQRK